MVQSRTTELLDSHLKETLGAGGAAAASMPKRAGPADTHGSALGGRLRLTLVGRDEAMRLIGDLRNSGIASHFQTEAWLEAVTDAMDGGESVLFVAGHDGQRCRIVLPLALSQRYGLRRIGWLGQAVSDYNAPLFDPDFVRALTGSDVRRLWRDAARLAGGADVVYARKQPVSIAGIENPFSAVACGRESDQAHLCNLLRPWPVVETELSSAKSRRRLREKHRALEKLGAVEIRAASGPDEIRQCAEKLMDWKSGQLDESGATNPFADMAYRRFFHSICARGVAGLHGVFIDASPVALTCLLTDAKGWTLYQTGFDRAYSRHSPGRILNLALLKRASEAGARFFDFGFGDEDYKRSMCNRSLDLTYSIIPLSPRGAVAALALRAAMAARRAVKKNPRLRRAAFFLNRLF